MLRIRKVYIYASPYFIMINRIVSWQHELGTYHGCAKDFISDSNF